MAGPERRLARVTSCQDWPAAMRGGLGRVGWRLRVCSRNHSSWRASSRLPAQLPLYDRQMATSTMKYVQLVIGPAGSGKSTYCENIKQHCDTIGRPVHVFNLDPAAEHFGYPIHGDIRDLITIDDAQEELKLGPNGALLFCMEFMEQNLEDWLGELLEGYGEDDYLLFDCPGQIELYSHVTVFRTLVDFLKNRGWQVCVVYCLDSQFVSSATKFIAGVMQTLSAMVLLEVPHVSVLTKLDICPDRDAVERLAMPDGQTLKCELDDSMPPRFHRLNEEMAQVIDEWSLVSFCALDIRDEESISEVLGHIDTAIQFGEDAEVKARDFDEGGIEPNMCEGPDFGGGEW